MARAHSGARAQNIMARAQDKNSSTNANIIGMTPG